MSTIKSSDEHLTLNADGSSKDIKFQANGVEKASISSSGAFTSTTIDATALTGDLPALNASSLTNLDAADVSGTHTNFTSTGIDDNADATAITITSAEKVGIGTTSPDKMLDILSDSSSPALLIKAASQTGSTSPTAELILSSGSLSSNDSACKVTSYRCDDYSTAVKRSSGLKFQVTNANASKLAMAIDNDGNVTALEGIQLGLIDSTYTSGEGHSLNSYAGAANHETYMQGRNAADTSNVFFSEVSGNPKVMFTAAGNGYWDGTGDLGSADYAEYFEWADGNPSNEDRVGMSVSMVGNKIKIAEDGDVVMGIVSARPAIVGDSASLGWQGKWETDIYGRRVQQDTIIYSWEEEITNEDEETSIVSREYRQDEIPEGVTVPDDATSVFRQEDKLSSEYDADVDYVPRSDRKEWSAIGLMGKLKLRTGQVTDSRWIKMRDMSDTVEEWLVR